ncbi:DegT/DnrJ/EryC1/StrS family aminotransferase [SCandidatus Aminicenantes bacterium Aminicenantia_JdfR_composite]|jgi:dTDP-4-amino-4,6-dideoxygalactose transaminase|nr:DegT/DnrJ/EryC1/StrS family aminotransferase [SCandidatus Aminicenantes bacterium Aminicenantia_JdfR_composite]MCP2597733.1 DegT/DnrJ/EryC1/StrS family aminotransferase [Candidatus Aminicenantes bacterium AC-335-L06]MCP2620900.1 DegT/DnrJ/EryC1/StrS family aminotransferase [Candidatus Aminicenantes bacterium AC-334-E05]
MYVPLLDLKAQYQKIKEEIKKAIDEVLESQRFILGPKVEELEKNIAKYSDTKYAIGVSSGTDALLVSLMAFEIKPGDEIITTPFTFFSTAGVIARLNAVPVFIDIDPVTYNIDSNKLRDLIEFKAKNSKFRIKCIIPVHLFGQCADMAPILEIARKYNIYVLEDAAQSIGAEYPFSSTVKKAGSMGDTGIFSFFPSKNLGGFGDGGMVVTNDENLYQKIKMLRVHGAEPKYYHKMIGGNFRLDALQAAVLNVKLKYLNEWSKKRRENAEYYNKRFEEEGLIGKGYIKVPVPVFKNKCNNYHIFNQYTIRAKERDKLREFLKENSIGTEIYYPIPLHLQKCFQYLGYKKGDFPVSEEASKSVLSLPIYPELSNEQKEYVIEKIKEFYKRK